MKAQLRLRSCRAGLTLLLALAAALPMTGTTVPRMNLEALVAASDRILQGKIEETDVYFDEAMGLPFTRARVRVDDPLCQRPQAGVRCHAAAGDRRATVFLKHVGGRYFDQRRQQYLTVAASGTPQFKGGDNVIVFLRELPDGTFQCVGMNQGRYQVIDELAVANISGVELFDPKTGKTMPAGFIEKAPVDAFKAKIRELLQ